ncbi:ribosome biogenesis protein SLX9-domain-containing protein, partial [Vararia minispora EC-137]
HEAPVKPVKRQFAVQEEAVKHVEIGNMEDASGNDILQAIAAEDEGGTHLKKKEKRQLKHELFLERLEINRAPYSKSHARRLKRKERDQLASGSLTDLAAALAKVDAPATGPSVLASSSEKKDTLSGAEPVQKAQPGQIGAGKSAPLKVSKRKQALRVEQFRMPQILANPAFASSPFETIRTHAKNTLVQHKPPPAE